MTLDDANTTVNIQQAMELAGVSRRTVHYWIAQRKVEVLETPSGRKRIILASLLRRPQDNAQTRAE